MVNDVEGFMQIALGIVVFVGFGSFAVYSVLSLYLARQISVSEQRTVPFILAIFIPAEVYASPRRAKLRTSARTGLAVFLCSVVVALLVMWYVVDSGMLPIENVV